MLVIRMIQLAVLAVGALMPVSDAAAKPAVKLCGRTLSDIMSRVCYAYNSPSPAYYISPTVKEHPGSVRRKRHLGIADQCCTIGCTWEQLNEYCAISVNPDSPMIGSESHTIADRSAEGRKSIVSDAAAPSFVESPVVPPVIGGKTAGVISEGESEGKAQGSTSAQREVGRGRSSGYGRARAKGRRCWCRRKRRSDRRRRTFLMGNMGLIRNSVRAAPMVGTVSPLLTWGRTLNTDFPPVNRERYTYVVYT